MDGDFDVEGVRARLLEVVQETGGSRSALARKAGLSPSHVGLIIRGVVGANVTHGTLAKLAAAAGVTYRWLAFGELPKRPPAVVVELDERYPNRALAIAGARVSFAGHPHLDAAIADLRNHLLRSNTDRAVSFWTGELEELLEEHASGRRGVLDASEDEPTPAVLGLLPSPKT